MAEPDLNISIIGAGNVAYGLGMALKNVTRIDYIYSRTFQSAKALARKLRAKPAEGYFPVVKSDFIICAVDDDSLPDVALALQTVLGNNKKSIVLHTSGSMPISVFKGYVKNYGALYPLQTFTKGRRVKIQKVPMLIHGNNSQVIKKISGLASLVSDNVVRMDDDQRKSVHLPAVFINNFVNHLLYKSELLIEELNLDRTLYIPLLDETIKKAKAYGAYSSQTGPAIRKDIEVIEKHRLSLSDNPDLLALYNQFTESIIKTYHENIR